MEQLLQRSMRNIDRRPVMKICHGWMLSLAMSALALATPAWAQDDQAAELAKKLSNPVASLISVPLQYNYDTYGGANDGASVSRLVIQPVVPFSLNEELEPDHAHPHPADRSTGFSVCRDERIGSR